MGERATARLLYNLLEVEVGWGSKGARLKSMSIQIEDLTHNPTRT